MKEAGQFRKFYRHVIYVVPTCANPSGKTMPLHRREALVRLGRKYNALIICDDVYDLLQWQTNPSDPKASAGLRPDECPEMMLPRLCDIDLAMDPSPDDPRGFGYAVSNGSFSKMAGPGMRTGWLEGSRAFAHGLAQTGATKSGGSPSQFSASVLADMLQSGTLQDYLTKTVRPSLQRRHRVMMDTIHEHIVPLGISVREAGVKGGNVYGGYFVWLTLNEGLSSKLVADAALAEEKLIVGNGTMFQVHGDEGSVDVDGFIRLTFSYIPEEDLVEGVKRLARVLRKMQQNPTKYQRSEGTSLDASRIDAHK